MRVAIILLVLLSASPAMAADRNWEACAKASAEESIRGCTAVLDRGGGSARNRAAAFYNRGNAFQNQENYDRAISDYDEAIRLNPKFASAHNNRGLAYSRKKDYDRAFRDYDEAIRLDWKLASAYNNRGLAWFSRLYYNRAIDDYSEAVRLDPKFARAYANRGFAYFNTQDFARAVADYDVALRLEPDNALTALDRARARLKTGDPDGSIADFESVIRRVPGYDDYGRPERAAAYAARAEAKARRGDTEGALADATRSLSLQPLAGAYATRASALARKGDFDGADKAIAKAFELDGDDASIFLRRGEIRLMHGIANAARADFAATLMRQPGNRAAQEGLEAAMRAPVSAAVAARQADPPAAPTAAPPVAAAPAAPPPVVAPHPPAASPVMAGSVPTAPAERRVALVVGNNAYPNLRLPTDPDFGQLRQAIPDAKTMGEALRGLGFEVEVATDVDQGQFLAALDRLKARVAPGATVFVHFSGHGVSLRGANLLLPTDIPAVDPQADELMRRRAIGEADIIETLREKGPAAVILTLDACRDNPIEAMARARAAQQGRVASRTLGAMASRGLDAQTPKSGGGVFVVYAADLGERALDRAPGSGDNSVFTSVFVRRLGEKGRHLADIMDDVTQEVAEIASKVTDPETLRPHEQHPATYNGMRGRRIFLAGPPPQ